jgi:hypothetical protein
MIDYLILFQTLMYWRGLGDRHTREARGLGTLPMRSVPRPASRSKAKETPYS